MGLVSATTYSHKLYRLSHYSVTDRHIIKHNICDGLFEESRRLIDFINSSLGIRNKIHTLIKWFLLNN